MFSSGWKILPADNPARRLQRHGQCGEQLNWVGVIWLNP